MVVSVPAVVNAPVVPEVPVVVSASAPTVDNAPVVPAVVVSTPAVVVSASAPTVDNAPVVDAPVPAVVGAPVPAVVNAPVVVVVPAAVEVSVATFPGLFSAEYTVLTAPVTKPLPINACAAVVPRSVSHDLPSAMFCITLAEVSSANSALISPFNALTKPFFAAT